jgi:putative selenate reductase
MVELYCTPFVEMLDRLRHELATQAAIYDLPVKKWYLPQPGDPDLSVRFHDMIADNPVGPASGPQSQMAQNLVLSWLAGSRIMELKTVQLNDRLDIGRPCIDATNIGYNIEWSQELLVHESLDQYVQGAMLIHALAHAPEAFGHPFGEIDMRAAADRTIYDMSIGYDLAGIQSDKVTGFMREMIDATQSVERLRAEIPERFAALRELNFPTQLSRSVTLSTFHGCPADEIERICEYLLTDIGVHTIVKMNPPMLGKERLEHLLYDVMGYHDITVHQDAYTNGLMFAESVEMTKRLTDLAKTKGLSFGAKFSNTLEVTNHRDFFSKEEKVMYLSGAPLHVITMTLAGDYRQAVGAAVPISFSAGVDRKNFPKLVACGFTPITTCTDLLKVGGYGRLPPYLNDLKKEMRAVEAGSINEFVSKKHGQSAPAGDDPVEAGFLNTPLVIEETQADPRYYQAKNQGVPRRIDSHLTLFDCITCYKCIPVCPNDANFVYPTPATNIAYRNVIVSADGTIQETGDEQIFTLEQSDQIANFADYCNHCGNCDTFCPEYDGPYLMKPSFFGSLTAFEAGAPHDGFHLVNKNQLQARIDQCVQQLERRSDRNYVYFDGTVSLEWKDGTFSSCDSSTHPPADHPVDVGRFHALVALLTGITDTSRIHAVNAGLISRAESTA